MIPSAPLLNRLNYGQMTFCIDQTLGSETNFLKKTKNQFFAGRHSGENKSESSTDGVNVRIHGLLLCSHGNHSVT